ncbi:hypothetical protein [Aeromonas hydrophila]|uniref:hypothetical protein n=1 Tax=Aeromonas hydrophila TaxID=644 RepID=UPI002B055014|nr:hypothetical protein [Aeromonas hydrophila]
MYWPDTQTGIDVEPARKPVASAVRKFFTEGGAGQPPTVPGGDWFNQITNELLNVVTAAGLEPSKTDDDQLLQAINIFDGKFSSIQNMLSANHLQIGQNVSTGATTWKIVSSNKGWPLDNGTQYAIPLNGVWVEDAGADATGTSDSYAEIMYVINNYNADTRRKFAICFGGGYYKTSGQIALHALTSGIKLNFGGATLEATANMPSLISCPAISGLRLEGVKVQHSVGVTIANAMIHINTESGNANKTTRHIIDDINAGLITGSPLLLLCEKMWESEIRRIRADRDVAGMTGEIVNLKSCVNCTIQPSELGYCAVAWRLSKSPAVSHGCEGITFNGGITTYAKVPIAIDSGTAIRLKGMVLDFCETSGPTFSNGQDVSLEGCWIANTSISNEWSGFVGLPVTNRVKIIGCHFVNNSANPAYCASMNVPKSIFAGNTSAGCLPGFRHASGVQEFGNQYDDNGVNRFFGGAFEFQANPGVAPNISFNSGKNINLSYQLLQRISLIAPLLNQNNIIQLDHFQGAFSDQPILKMAWNGTYKYAFNFITGDIEILQAGRGIRLVSPDGLTTRTLRLSNAGTLELI